MELVKQREVMENLGSTKGKRGGKSAWETEEREGSRKLQHTARDAERMRTLWVCSQTL